MTPQRVEQWVWVLVYGGLLCMSLGWFVTPAQGPWGELMVSGGVVAALAGVVLIVIRSKMKP
jgi:hypothetical protein